MLNTTKKINYIVITLIILLISCENDDNQNIKGQLKSESVYSLSIKEPSDLCFGSDYSTLYTVSDDTGKAYLITLNGNVLSALNFTGNDLEGIAYVNEQFLFVAEERLRYIVKLDLQGNEISRKEIPVEKNNENLGLEGITYSTLNKQFYILNEKNPGLLIVTDENLNIVNQFSLSLANDYSGICIDDKKQELWILSDESTSVYRCTLQGSLIESFRIPVTNPEGIAVNPEKRKIYIVSDSQAKLYVFNY